MTLGSHNIEFTYTGETWVAKLPNQTVTTPVATPANNVWQWYDNGTEMIPYKTQDDLQRILAGNSTPKPAATTSTVTRAAAELSDEALYTGMHVTDDGVGAALRGAGHNMPTPTSTPKPAVKVPTPVKAPFNPVSAVPVTDLKNVKLDMATPKPAVKVPTPVKAPFNPVSAVPVTDLKNVKLDTEAISKVDDVAKGFNWKKAGKWALIGLGAAALIGGAIWLINKLNKKDEAPVDKTPVEETPATTEAEAPETPEAPEAPVAPVATTEAEAPETPEAPVAPIEPEVPVVPVEPTEPEAPVAPTEPTEPEAPATPELKTEYEVKAGDSFWSIAEKHLKAKYANDPEKCANLTNAEINTEMFRLIKLYEETLNEGKDEKDKRKVELVNMEINGKVQTVTMPMIHPGDKIKV